MYYHVISEYCQFEFLLLTLYVFILFALLHWLELPVCGVWNMSSQNMPLWHIGYFELKGLKKQPVQERHSDPSFSSWKQEINLPCERCPPCTRMIEDILTTKDREFRIEKAVQSALCICGFCIHGLNHLQLESIPKNPENSRKFPKAKLKFYKHQQLFT